MNSDFVSIGGKFLPRRMVLQGIASLFGGALAPGAFAATKNNCQLTERDILGPFYRFGAPFQTKLAGPARGPGERRSDMTLDVVVVLIELPPTPKIDHQLSTSKAVIRGCVLLGYPYSITGEAWDVLSCVGEAPSCHSHRESLLLQS